MANMTPTSHRADSELGAAAETFLRRLHKPPRILVAEDDQELRSLLADDLRNAGYEVLEVADGGRLLEQVASARANPDATISLVISDIRMPVFSGFEVVQRLRNSLWAGPVILTTAFGDDETRTRAAGLGAILFDKPFTLQDMRTAVANLLLG
jgi:two-component system, response regulator, stage 0 sporulation protein F